MNWKLKSDPPKKSGDYLIQYSDGTTGVGRYNRGLFGLGYLCYWSCEEYAGKVVVKWSERSC